MDYREILQVAIIKLSENHRSVIDLKELIASGSTGGEITGMVGKYLKNLKLNDQESYSALESEINEYLNNCKRAGLIIL